LLIYAAAWLVACAMWIGFTRRRTFQFFFTALVGNGFLLACVGMLQRVKGNGRVLGIFESPTSYFVATLLYKNHAAAYFNILLGLAAGLSFWFYTRNLRRLEKSSPAGIFAFFAAAIAVIVLFSFSRAGTILMLTLTVALLGIFLVRQFRLLLGSFVWLGSYSMQLDRVTESMGRLFKGDRESSIEYRESAHQATWEMAQDRPGFGWGSGGFRFLFPLYQQRHEQIFRDPGGHRLYWEHAHNDYLELLAELGAVGCGLLGLGLGFAGWISLKPHARGNPLVLFGLLGLGTTLAHAWVDFPFQNPAILTTWCVPLGGVGGDECESLRTDGG
jgi:O-antigen ligase